MTTLATSCHVEARSFILEIWNLNKLYDLKGKFLSCETKPNELKVMKYIADLVMITFWEQGQLVTSRTFWIYFRLLFVCLNTLQTNTGHYSCYLKCESRNVRNTVLLLCIEYGLFKVFDIKKKTTRVNSELHRIRFCLHW